MLASLRAVRYPVETALLVGLCLVLPILEAPKNLLWLAYVAAWIVNRAQAGCRPPGVADSLSRAAPFPAQRLF